MYVDLKEDLEDEHDAAFDDEASEEVDDKSVCQTVVLQLTPFTYTSFEVKLSL